MRRKVLVVTGTRAEFGLLSGLMKLLQDDCELELQVLATGMHLSPEFGLTYQQIEEEGFHIDLKVEMLLSSDTPAGIVKSMGIGLIGFADAFQELAPDMIVLLGDRFEALAAAQAALMMRIPIAHIHGGETTVGAVDESIRHSITKMSALHFTASEEFKHRVVQLGENPSRVFVTGAPGIDNISKMQLLPLDDMEARLEMHLRDGFFLVTYHPETLSKGSVEDAVTHLLDALDRFPEKKVVISKANADAAGRTINNLIDRYAQAQPERVRARTSLGQLLYLSCLKACDVVVGNSSSGIIEAPVLKVPTVNIGDRQAGRLRAESIIDCAEDTASIEAAIRSALSPEFKRGLSKVESRYGNGNASEAIYGHLRSFLLTADLHSLLLKRFHDLP